MRNFRVKNWKNRMKLMNKIEIYLFSQLCIGTLARNFRVTERKLFVLKGVKHCLALGGTRSGIAVLTMCYTDLAFHFFELIAVNLEALPWM